MEGPQGRTHKTTKEKIKYGVIKMQGFHRCFLYLL